MIDNLPSVEGSLQCVFSAMSKDLTTDAKRTAQGVSCTTPRNDMLPDIPQNERKSKDLSLNEHSINLGLYFEILFFFVMHIPKPVKYSLQIKLLFSYSCLYYILCATYAYRSMIIKLGIIFSDHFTAKLSVRKSEGPEFVSTNFTFFDCNTYSSCTECVSSPFPCDWCVDGHRCTHDSAENCRNDVLVNGVNVRIKPVNECFSS